MIDERRGVGWYNMKKFTHDNNTLWSYSNELQVLSVT